MSHLHLIARHPRIYMAFSTLLVLLAISVAGWLSGRNIEADRDIPLVKALGTYAATLEGGTVSSRAMGAAMLFGLENREAKQLSLGMLPPDAPEILSALDTLRTLYLAEAVFVVNRQGVVVAYSGGDRAHGIGRDLSFRPYIKLAMQGTPNVYPAVRSDDNVRGIYLAAPLRAATISNSEVIGAVVVRVGSDKLDALLKSWTNGIAVLLSPQGVIFSAGRDDWLFRVTGAMSADRIAEIRRTMQFGKLFDQPPLPALPFTLATPETSIDGVRYAVRSTPLEWNDPEGDWMLGLLERRAPWWTDWRVQAFAGLAGLVAALVLFWFYALARNALLSENMNAKLRLNEDALRKNEVLLKEAQSIAGLGSYVLDIPSGSFRSSGVLDRLFGIDEAYEHSSAGWLALIHPDDRTMLADYLKNEVVGQGKAFDKEYRIIRHNDQAERWLHGLGKLEFDAPRHPVEMRGAVHDLTESHPAEIQVARSI